MDRFILGCFGEVVQTLVDLLLEWLGVQVLQKSTRSAARLVHGGKAKPASWAQPNVTGDGGRQRTKEDLLYTHGLASDSEKVHQATCE